jgi:hypothetical protein
MTKKADGNGNGLCPCGSGRKYAECCREEQEELWTPPGSSGVLDGMRQAMQGKEFKTLEEARIFAEDFFRRQNQTQLEDFQGLAPEQMHRFLSFPFESPELVTFSSLLETPPEAPIVTLLGLLTDAVGKQGLKATATGNLPQKFCREAALRFWGEEVYQKNTRYGGINKETDFFDLHITRLVAGLAGLVRKYKGRFVLTGECRKLLDGHEMAAIYPRLLYTYVRSFNWGYRDHHQEIPFIQQSFLFTLFLLHKYGHDWMPHIFYEDCFLRAFPAVLTQVKPGSYFPPEREVRSCYAQRVLHGFAAFFGLAVVESTGRDGYKEQYRVKALPLLTEVVRFHI